MRHPARPTIRIHPSMFEALLDGQGVKLRNGTVIALDEKLTPNEVSRMALEAARRDRETL